MTGVQTCALPICFPVTIEYDDGAMTFAEVIRKDREECNCEKCKTEKEAQNGSNGAG